MARKEQNMSDDSKVVWQFDMRTDQIGAAVDGMTMRDYFAANAMALVAQELSLDDTWTQAIAKEAYAVADAMLKERAK
jgi:hypothetical protein